MSKIFVCISILFFPRRSSDIKINSLQTVIVIRNLGFTTGQLHNDYKQAEAEVVPSSNSVKMKFSKDIVPVHAILEEITTWCSLSRGQIVQISTKNSILSYFALGLVKIRPTVP